MNRYVSTSEVIYGVVQNQIYVESQTKSSHFVCLIAKVNIQKMYRSLTPYALSNLNEWRSLPPEA